MADLQARDHAMSPSHSRTLSSGTLSRQTTNSEYGDLGEPPEAEGEKPSRNRSRSFASTTARDLDLTRTVTRRETVLSRIRTRPPIGTFSHPLAHAKTTVEDLVDFDGPDDPYRPINWAMKKKVFTTALYGFTTMTATWGSSAFSPGTAQVAEEFHVGEQVAILGTTLFLFGFGIGPLLWAPLSEVFGRTVCSSKRVPDVLAEGCAECCFAPNVHFCVFSVRNGNGKGHPDYHDHTILCWVSAVDGLGGLD